MGSSIVVSFVSLFAFLVFLLGICIFRASRKEHAMAKNVIYLLIAIIAAIVIQCILLFVPNEKTAVIVNSLFFVNVDLIRLLALIITVEFTGYVFRHEKAYLMIKLVTAMDCLLMIVNIYTGQVFTCVKMQLGDIYYYKVDIEPFFTVHALIAYATIGFILFMIYKKVASLSIEYWTKYIALGVTFSIAVIVNIVYLFSNYAVDISVVSYVNIRHYTHIPADRSRQSYLNPALSEKP